MILIAMFFGFCLGIWDLKLHCDVYLAYLAVFTCDFIIPSGFSLIWLTLEIKCFNRS